tara:strand:- start:25 stop:2292 length:2268 start_codon:yes stop_codon:yes gene_type:complete
MLASPEQKRSIKEAILGVCNHAVKVANVPKDDFTFLRSNFSADVRAFLKQTSARHFFDSESMQLSNFYLANFLFSAESPEHASHLLRESPVLNAQEALLTTGFIPIKDLFLEHEIAYSRFVSERTSRKYDGGGKFCKHLLEHSHLIDEFLDVVPINLDGLTATPGQIAVAIWGSSRLDVDAEASSKSALLGKRQKILMAGTAPSLRINTSLMGSGKTFQSFLTALYPLLSDSAFKSLSTQRQVDSNGLTDQLIKPILRCVVYVVPVSLKKQWHACLKNFLAPLNGKVELLYEIRNRPLSSLAANKPTIWLLPQNKTVGAWLKEAPQFRFISLIVDEATSPIKSRGTDDIARPIITHVLSATPMSLSNLSTRTENPISEALGRNPSPNDDTSWMSYVHSFLPEPIRALANANAIAKMPSGVQNVVLRTKLFNLSTLGTGANDNIFRPKSFVDFLRTISPPHASDRSFINHQEFEELVAIVRGKPLTFDLVATVLGKASVMLRLTEDPAVNARIGERKRVLARVVNNINGVASGEIEDPITLEPMQREDTVLLPCCLNAIGRSSAARIHATTRTCPLCRAKLEAVEFGDVAEDSAEIGVVDEVGGLDYSLPFMTTVDNVSAKRLQPLDAIAATIISACRTTAPARIMLAASSLGLGVSTGTTALLEVLALHVPELEVVSPGGAKRFDPLRFNNIRIPHPMLLLLDAGLHSSGLDLPKITHTIVAGTARADLLSQSISRALRMGAGGGEVKFIVSILS